MKKYANLAVELVSWNSHNERRYDFPLCINSLDVELY